MNETDTEIDSSRTSIDFPRFRGATISITRSTLSCEFCLRTVNVGRLLSDVEVDVPIRPMCDAKPGIAEVKPFIEKHGDSLNATTDFYVMFASLKATLASPSPAITGLHHHIHKWQLLV